MGFGELGSTSTSTTTFLLWILVIPSVFCGGWDIARWPPDASPWSAEVTLSLFLGVCVFRVVDSRGY